MGRSRLVLGAVTIGVIGGCMMATSSVAAGGSDLLLNRRWAEQVFSDRPVQAARRNQLAIVHEDVAGDTKLGRCSAGPPMRLGEKVYQHGIGVNSLSVLRVTLEKPAKAFRAVIGLDRNVDNTPASVGFHVSVEGKDVFATEVIRAGAPSRPIDVPLNGATSFDLTVDVGGDDRGWDQGDWADAKVVLQDGSEMWLDDIVQVTTVEAGLPFSFVYGGKPSSEFIDGWRREATVEQVSDTVSRRTLTLTDPATGLEVKAVCSIYLDTPGTDWTVYFTNKGSADSPLIEQVRTVDTRVTVGVGSDVVLHRLNGSMCQADDWMPFDQTVPAGTKIDFSATNGRSSNVSPWFTLDWGSGGAITAIGWSGQWTASVELKDGRLGASAGMQNLHTILHPGESIRGPRILQLLWEGGDQYRAYNLFRHTMLAHIVPRIDGKVVLPPIAQMSTSYYELNGSNEQNVLSHLDSTKGLGFEVFWLDAYWTGPSGFPGSMGNYGFPIEIAEPKDRFPHGMRAIGDAVEKAGLDYLMWFEPERVAAGTYLADEHRAWVISPTGDGSGLLNLGIPEARRHVTDYLNAVIKAYKLTCLRIDYNIDPLSYWQFEDAKDSNRVGIAEIRYIEGLYRMWDDLLRTNPKLYIDDCASGGRRVDLEAVSRALVLWRSDNTCDMLDHNPNTVLLAAVKNQVMSAGLNRYLPFSTVGQMGATPYLFRSGFNAGIAFGEDIRGSDYPRKLLAQGIAEGKRIRKYFLGDFYPLSDINTSPREWCVMQYHRPKERDGMVMAFRRDRSPFTGYGCKLRAIDPSANYQVTVSHGYDRESPVTMKGVDLQNLNVQIHELPGSAIVEYKRLDR